MSELLTGSLRALVQQRARGRCEYCLLHEEDAILAHEPDHIVALKHGGKTHEDNLAWTCFACNRYKGTDLASINYETGRLVRLFNPRMTNGQNTFAWKVLLLSQRPRRDALLNTSCSSTGLNGLKDESS